MASSVIIISTTEQNVFSGSFSACLIESKAQQAKTKFAVIVENDIGVRFSMKEQEELFLGSFKAY